MNLKEKIKSNKWWKRYFKSKKFQDIVKRAKQEYHGGKYITLRTSQEIDDYFASL